VKKETCDSCKFFQGAPARAVLLDQPKAGACVRHPPAMLFNEDPLSGQSGYSPMFPIVAAVMWCGDYQRATILQEK
jgi:hypothetical protein